MASQYWSSADLKAVQFGGLINEDVMQQIFDISRIPLPVQDMVATDGVSNSTTSWTTDELDAPDVTNAQVDGRDSTTNDARGGVRVQNECQISTKDVQVSFRADESDTIGRASELSYQVMQRQRELRRDVDAIFLLNQASVKDDGNTTPGRTGGLAAWLVTNTDRGATGSDGGFNPATGAVDAATPGNSRALTETAIRNIAQSVYEQGGMSEVLMSTPSVIRKLSEYMFTDSARIATLESGVGQSQTSSTAKGSVNVFVTDFGQVLRFVPNRLQQLDGSGDADVFILDPSLLRLGLLHGYRTVPLNRTGLAEKRLMAVDWCVKVLNEKGQGVIADVDPTVAVTA